MLLRTYTSALPRQRESRKDIKIAAPRVTYRVCRLFSKRESALCVRAQEFRYGTWVLRRVGAHRYSHTPVVNASRSRRQRNNEEKGGGGGGGGRGNLSPSEKGEGALVVLTTEEGGDSRAVRASIPVRTHCRRRKFRNYKREKGGKYSLGSKYVRKLPPPRPLSRVEITDGEKKRTCKKAQIRAMLLYCRFRFGTFIGRSRKESDLASIFSSQPWPAPFPSWAVTFWGFGVFISY